jgi:Zn-dependent protease with chaperone function
MGVSFPLEGKGRLRQAGGMSRDDFDALVKTLEEQAQRRPGWYAAKVAALAALAYTYIGLVFVLMVALVVGVVALVIRAPNAATIKLAFVLGAIGGGMAWAILKGLWVRLPPPEGLRLDPASAPALFQLIEELRRELRGPGFHEVLLEGSFNAAVMQVPRLGVFGWQKNYLLLGLPLMEGLSPEEFKAVLAHEFGHLSANHSRFGGWIYRLRRTWERIFEEIARRQQRGAFLLTKFLAWFWPQFNAHAFVLSRANEYVADACSAQATNPAQAASALARCHLLGALLDEKFWPETFKRANNEAAPPADIYARAAALLRQPPATTDSARWLRAGFLLPTTNSQTHPSLTDRLRALGQLPTGADQGDFPTALPSVTGPSAAEAFLGTSLPALSGRLSREWSEAVQEGWRSRHAEVARLREEMALAEAAATEGPSAEQLWKKAELLLKLEGDEAARPVVDELLAICPNHAIANFARGRHALEQDDPAGVLFLERAMAADVNAVPSACEQLYAYFARTGQREQLRAVELRMDAYHELMQKAQTERAEVTAKDPLMPAALTPEQVRQLTTLFATEKDVFEVHAARKVVAHLPENPFYVLVITVRPPWYVPRGNDANQKLVHRVIEQIQLPGHFYVCAPGRKLDALGKSVAKQTGALVYRRSK